MVFLKPQTMVGKVGEYVKHAIKHFGINHDPSDICVFADSLAQKVGRFRIVAGTSFAGHAGLQSISDHLDGMDGFLRTAIGIGSPNSTDPAALEKHRLGNFTEPELNILEKKVFPKIFEEHLIFMFFKP